MPLCVYKRASFARVFMLFMEEFYDDVDDILQNAKERKGVVV